MKPFRWDLSRVEQLGTLVDANDRTVDAEWLTRIVEASVKIVARSSGAELVFVGRSPETPSNHSERWTEENMLGPSRTEQTQAALQLAYTLFSVGTEQRREFGRLLAGSGASGEPWLRALMSELRP